MTNQVSAADLLLHCLSTRAEPAFSNQVGRISPNHWSEVVDSAVYHDLAPLLFKRLKESDTRAHVPADAWERLRLAYFVNAGRNMRLYRELRTALRCLRSSGVPVIVLKGAYLATAIYGDIALRPMNDVDLLVPEAELSRAQTVLFDMGCFHPQLVSRAASASGEQSRGIESRFRRGRGLQLAGDAGIDIQWTLEFPVGPFRLDSSGFWDRARPAMIAGVEVLALSPEDLLLHLCSHATYVHCLDGNGLRHLCDIAETIHRYRGEMAWAEIIHRAREWGASRHVGLALHLAGSMLSTEVPADVPGRLVPEGLDQRILETARERVLAQTPTDQWAARPLFELLGVRSLGDMVKLSWGRVFCSRAEMAVIYPSSRDSKHLYFYYVLRLRDVIQTFRDHTRMQALLRNESCEVRKVKGGRRVAELESRTASPLADRNVSLFNWLKSGRP
jgi:hypothetical protein